MNDDMTQELPYRGAVDDGKILSLRPRGNPHENTRHIFDEHGQTWARDGNRFVLLAPDVDIYFEMIDGEMVYSDEAQRHLEELEYITHSGNTDLRMSTVNKPMDNVVLKAGGW